MTEELNETTQTAQEAVPAPETTPTNDIVERVQKVTESTPPSPEDTVFDFKEIQSIQDPTARDITERMYKSMQGERGKYARGKSKV